MTADEKETFVGRWSRRKAQARQEESAPKAQEKPVPSLPPVEKLTPESEFSGFMHPKVADALRRVALKKLFTDPHFNVPDPFEPYSGDWIAGEPISEKMLATLNQAKTHLFSQEKKDAEQPAPEETAQAAKTENEPDEPGRQDT
jgi:hypothetical protein